MTDENSYKLNPDVKEKWVAALRSGKYQQGKDALKTTRFGARHTEYCCLGVLCEIAVQEGVIPAPVREPGGSWIYGNGLEESWSSLPPAVSNWAGLTDIHDPWVTAHDPYATDKEDKFPLSGLNDAGTTFDLIANYIEEQL